MMSKFENPDHTMQWKEVGLKEYYQYFAIFDKTNPTIHKRITFDEWNAEVLFNVMKKLINAKRCGSNYGCRKSIGLVVVLVKNTKHRRVQRKPTRA